ncbi:MAG TPA: hypothetical protein VLC54_03895, partial [Anaeromyxobacter sp.]|nr:hypothetical protein [Anaeromyxobacter sp.]
LDARELSVWTRDAGTRGNSRSGRGWTRDASVWTRDASGAVEGGGNAFAADAGYTDVSLKPDVRWDTDASLTVRYDPRLRVFTNEERVGRVDVRYLPNDGAP